MSNDIIWKIKDPVLYPTEEEWFEFKENWYQADGIGEYISSLSNAAAMKGESCGYLIWGVNNKTHAFTDTTINERIGEKSGLFHTKWKKDHKTQQLVSANQMHSSCCVFRTLSGYFFEVILNGRR